MVLNKRLKLFFAVCIFSFFLIPCFSLNVPKNIGRVSDYANIINSKTEQELNDYLYSLEQSTGIQIVVLTIPSLENENISTFAFRTAEEWKIGDAKKDNGALLLVAYEDHEVFISTGYGLEDKLTDAKCGLIVRNVIIPEFRNGNYSAGIYKGIKNMGGLASDNAELVASSVMNDSEESSEWAGFIFMIFWLVFIFIVITSKGGIFKWIFLSQLFGSSNHRHNYYGSFGGGRSSSHSRSSFNSSSFHGGGGHFGGGGAGGHW